MAEISQLPQEESSAGASGECDVHRIVHGHDDSVSNIME